jgi:hypothetical protein
MEEPHVFVLVCMVKPGKIMNLWLLNGKRNSAKRARSHGLFAAFCPRNVQ